METWDAITSRRNVRSFADRPIPPADLDRILEAGRRAPSSQNWQAFIAGLAVNAVRVSRAESVPGGGA
jgi:nitroreductase